VLTQSQFRPLKLKKNVRRNISRTSQDNTKVNVDLVSRRQLLQPVDDEIMEILLVSFGIFRKLISSWGVIVKVLTR
jgi:hypothetical protein